eukprot:CAMPEP_0196761946 /NCGR_PEP_ID=MMETSP1095-20130614/1267_1 /TAXON_ID=96789 ORGANISM="Chromulina nebulosa, Strain UTEXLB2642" /NCGR_SAMPLE_ID=MMETSP1095 /ASSEMBLY_ACC=CAM_ASM_000446 /LENGTH=388 /DNA_ID=CAMNT_0042112081 /DNA_START=164 /DNA_END=1330 /DNA_ORIENTATION=-
MPPVVSTSKYYLISIYRNEVFLVATTTGETSPLLVIEFLHRVFDIFEEYFGTVEESTIKDNFASVYQLLEEMMDYGYPLTTEPNALKVMIKPNTVINRITSVAMGALGQSSNVSDVLPDGTLSNMPWRKTGVKYAQNEIYLDIIEEVDSIVDRNGIVITSEVSGVIQGNSKLSGVPDLALSFVDPTLIDDCSFHPCVRYNRFERDRVVSFVPPDGQFELMRYRVASKSPISAPCYCQPLLSFEYANERGTISLTIGTKHHCSLIFPQNKKNPIIVEDVLVVIPFSRNIRTANFTVTAGTILFDEATKIARWTVGKLTSEKNPQLQGTIMLQTSGGSEESPPIEMQWKVPMASFSGLAVSSLQLLNETYKPYKGVRTIAKAGKFQIRTT